MISWPLSSFQICSSSSVFPGTYGIMHGITVLSVGSPQGQGSVLLMGLFSTEPTLCCRVSKNRATSSLKRRVLQITLFYLYADTLLYSGNCLFFRDRNIPCGPTMQHVKGVQINGSGGRICLFHSPLSSLTIL